MPQHKASVIFLISVVTLQMIMKGISLVEALPHTRYVEGDISGSEFLTVFLESEPSDEQHVQDINKKEAPRITFDDEKLSQLSDDFLLDTVLEHQVPVTRNSRSSKNEFDESVLHNLKNKSLETDDLEAEGSSYYSENIADNEHTKNGFVSNAYAESTDPQDESPKIIGVRVTSSVAIGRGNKGAQSNPEIPIITSQDTARKVKAGAPVNRFSSDNPTTWRPPHFRFTSQDYYKGVPSNRHSVSTLPSPLLGANEDYIQQQKDRELSRKKQDNLHPYQRSIIYHNQPRESQRPRSFSYSSVINSFTDTKRSTVGDWSSSTIGELAVTEATAGYVTLINHGGNNALDISKDDMTLETVIKETDTLQKESTPTVIVPPLPHVYSEPAKIYSEPSKVYGEPSKVYGEPEKFYSEPAKVYSEPSKIYGEPSKVYSEPSKVYSEPSKVYGEPSKVYGMPSVAYQPPPQDIDVTKPAETNMDAGVEPIIADNNYPPSPTGQMPNKNTSEQNYEVDESTSVMSNGRTHGVQDKIQDDGQKVGYVVEGRNYRKYRVEERTADGFIVGEYGVVSHDDGSLRGVRYTADGTTNPRLIYDALMKFLSL